MRIGVLKSTDTPLAALVPAIAVKLLKDGHALSLEAGAGEQSFHTDEDYQEAGVEISTREEILGRSDILLADSSISKDDLSSIRSGALLVGRFNPLVEEELTRVLEESNINAFSLDMVPRSSIAQSMDILSSLASLSGYKAVISAAERYPGYFPMMTTAAGTVPPAKVLVLGAGVAGLQAIATAKRLGAVVEAFDVRSAVREEVESLGAKFIEVEGSREDKSAGGYAVEQTEAYIQKQKELIHERACKSDIVITTANIPGKKAPLLIEKRTVKAMKSGSIIIDMASASGGNCELSENDKEVDVSGVRILGDSKLFHQLPREASRLYSTNLYNFLKFLLKDGPENIPYDHEIVRKTLVGKLSEIQVAI